MSSVSEAFRRYLAEGRSCYVPRERIGFVDAARLIKKTGGVAVLAHPLQYGYNKSQLEALVKTAAQAGFSRHGNLLYRLHPGGSEEAV